VGKKPPAPGVYSDPLFGTAGEEQQGGNAPRGTGTTVSSCSANSSRVEGKTPQCYGWWIGLAGSGMLSLCPSQLLNGNEQGREACTPLPTAVPSAPNPQ